MSLTTNKILAQAQSMLQFMLAYFSGLCIADELKHRLAFKCTQSAKQSGQQEVAGRWGRGVGTAKSESQAQKYSKRSAAEKVHISRCHFLDFGNLAFKLRAGPQMYSTLPPPPYYGCICGCGCAY